ncbi:hypothetical protein QZH41_017973, partial [Actinostola sp. cb2023]
KQSHPTNKEWHVYLMVEFDADRAREHRLSDSRILKTKLYNKFQHYFNMHVCVQPWKDALWIRLLIHEGQKISSASSNSTVYFVHYPLSPYIMMTSIKAAHKQYIFQVLLDVLGCNNIKELDLTGKDVQSLANVVLNRRSQGHFSEYRLNQVDDNPLLQGSHAKKRNQGEAEETTDIRLVEENKLENDSKEKWMENAFGSRNKQPVLEHVKFTMETSFRGTHSLDFNKKSFRCSAKFEGPSVIEGIKNLGKAGKADLPLPSHLTNIHSSSRNHFTLTNRKRPRQIDSSMIMAGQV